jgi:hypothetical protein
MTRAAALAIAAVAAPSLIAAFSSGFIVIVNKF